MACPDVRMGGEVGVNITVSESSFGWVVVQVGVAKEFMGATALDVAVGIMVEILGPTKGVRVAVGAVGESVATTAEGDATAAAISVPVNSLPRR